MLEFFFYGNPLLPICAPLCDAVPLSLGVPAGFFPPPPLPPPPALQANAIQESGGFTSPYEITSLEQLENGIIKILSILPSIKYL
jgi:hypothetical protein